MYKQCPNCGECFPERGVKKFCSSQCRSAHFMRERRAAESLVTETENTLRNNHRLLKKLVGTEGVSIGTLTALGYAPKYYTGTAIIGGQKAVVIYDIALLQDSESTLKIVEYDG